MQPGRLTAYAQMMTVYDRQQTSLFKVSDRKETDKLFVDSSRRCGRVQEEDEKEEEKEKTQLLT